MIPKATFSPRLLPLWLKGYLLSLPIGINLLGGMTLADFFMICGLYLTLRPWSFSESISLASEDLAFLGFLAFTLFGQGIQIFSWLYFRDVLALVFLWSGFRILSREIRGSRKRVQALQWFGFGVALTIGILYLGILLEILGFQSFVRSSAGKFSWPFPFSNQLGFFLIMAYPLTHFLFSRTTILFPIFGNLLFFWIIAGIGSRTCLMVGILQLLACHIFLPRGRDKTTWRIIGAVSVLFLILAALFLTRQATFVRAMGNFEATGGFFQDLSRQRQVMEALTDSPNWWFSGRGLGCNKGVHGYEIHSTPLSILVETGIPGFLFLSLFFSQLVLRLSAIPSGQKILRHKFGRSLLISLGGILVCMLLHYLLRNRFFWLLLAILKGYDSHPETFGFRLFSAESSPDSTPPVKQLAPDGNAPPA